MSECEIQLSDMWEREICRLLAHTYTRDNLSDSAEK